MPNILPNTDRGLLTADNCALVFIDHQPKMALVFVSGIDGQFNPHNVLLLTHGAMLFDITMILTTIEQSHFHVTQCHQRPH